MSAEVCHTTKPHGLHHLASGKGVSQREPLPLQVTFLESLVTRLSHELAAVQLAQGGSPAAVQSPSAQGQAVATAAAAAVTPGPPAPWLTDQQMLTPLLKAYDERVAAQEADMATAAREAEALHKQVGPSAVGSHSWEVICYGLCLYTAHM